MADQIHKLNVGDMFDNRYELQKIIGIGGFAEVWRAIDMVTGVTKAIKVYATLDDEAFRDLAAEYACMEGINHPGLLHADHFDRWGNMPYLTMKYCSGGSLLHNTGNSTTEQLLDIIHDIADALTYLHDNDMVHQDIKPANILVDFRGEKISYLLSDFGISAKSRNQLTKSVRSKDADKKVAMTEAYAPPEKFSPKRAERLPHPKGDIFSLGITIYELATGHLPFDNLSTGREIFYNNVTVDLSKVSDPVIRRFVSRCLDPDRDKRPAANELVPLLEEISRHPVAEDTPNAGKKSSNDTVYLSDDDLDKKNHEQKERNKDLYNSGKRTVAVREKDLSGKYPVGGWFSSLTRGMKLTICGIAAFVIGIGIMFAIIKLQESDSSGQQEQTEKTEQKETADTKQSTLSFSTDGINRHYVEVLANTIAMQDNLRTIIQSSPTFHGMSTDDQEKIKEFVSSYNYLTTNQINNAYPPEKVGDDQVKNPHVTDKLKSMSIIYDNIKRKYIADWADINKR